MHPKIRKIKRRNNEKLVEKNRERILSVEGAAEYKTRMYTVEPVFGNIKFNTGFNRFLLRGIEKVKGEFNLACIGHNLKKIAKYMQTNKLGIEVLVN